MSFFKSFLTNKSVDLPTESRISALSKETVESNPRNRRLNSSNLEEVSSSRNKRAKEENKYLNLVNQELNNENETLKDKISDLKVTIKTNKQLLEEFIQNQSKIDRSVHILKIQTNLMSQKLRENNIEFEEELGIKINENKGTRSNSPTYEGPLSTLTTDRLAKGVNYETKTRSEHNVFTSSLSGPHSDDKYSSGANKNYRPNSLI